MGYKFQVATEPLLKEMGYKVIRAYHRVFTSDAQKEKGWKWYIEKLGSYLWNYSDYVVERNNRIYIVEVKSQGYVSLQRDQEVYRGAGETVSFSTQEKEEYATSPVPVLVLLMLYNWGGKVTELPPSKLEVKAVLKYSEKPDIKRLGPLFYKLVPFSDFQFKQGATGGILLDKFGGCKSLSSQEVYNLFRKTGALDIVGIEPGEVLRDRGR